MTKKIELIIGSLFAAVACIISIAGCASIPNPININGTGNQQGIFTTAVAYGVDSLLSQNPNDLGYVQGSQTALGILSGQTNAISVSEVEELLDSVGQTNTSVLIVTPLIVNLINSDIKSNTTTNPIAGLQNAQPYISWAITGIGQGIELYNLTHPSKPTIAPVNNSTN